MILSQPIVPFLPHLQVSPELWFPRSADVQNLFILDRNAVSLILKHSNKALTTSTFEHIHITQLKNIDRYENFISLFLSTLEGINPEKNDISPEYKEKRLYDEINAVKNFYIKARTDADFLISEDAVSILPHNNMFESFSMCLKFLYKSSEILYQPVSPSNYNDIHDKILELAELCSIPSSHIVVICTLACLYGNDDVKKILKFKKKYDYSFAYNAMSDITSILFVAVTINSFQNHKKVHFLSFDKPLKKLYDLFFKYGIYAYNPTHLYDGNNEEHSISFRMNIPPHNFFPNCTHEQYERIALLYPP